MSADTFDLICELDTPPRPNFQSVYDQIDSFSQISSLFFVPENSRGQARLSSLAVAHEIVERGNEAVLCLTCRDRSLLGLRRDLFTAAAYGIKKVLCVYGDVPSIGERVGDFKVPKMIETIQAFNEELRAFNVPSFEIGVVSDTAHFPMWKRDADFVFLQVTFDVQAVMDWFDKVEPQQEVYAGVMVIATVSMGKFIDEHVSGIDVPKELIARVAHDDAAGYDAAIEYISTLQHTGLLQGVHLITTSHYFQFVRHYLRTQQDAATR